MCSLVGYTIQKAIVVRVLLWTIMLKMDLQIYQSVYVPTHTYGHEMCSDSKGEVTDTIDQHIHRVAVPKGAFFKKVDFIFQLMI